MSSATDQILQLRDIHLPPPPPWWPPAPGWWLLAVLTVALLVLCGWWLVRAWRQRRRRCLMLLMLDELESELVHDPAPQRLAGLSALLKRLALKRHPRLDVAALSGASWLAFLDRTGGDGAFARGPGRVLADGAYRARLTEQLDVPGLMYAVRLWMQHNAGDHPCVSSSPGHGCF